MTDTNDEQNDAADEAEAADETEVAERPLSKAQKLEAKAARLRERELEREERRAAAAAAAPAAGDGHIAGFSPRTWVIAALVAAGLFVVSVAVDIPYIAHLHSQSSDRGKNLDKLRDLEVARTTLLTTANQYAIDFGSYDYRHLEADFAKVSSHLTPKFATSYKSVSTQLRESIEKYKGTSTATVQGVAVESLTAEQATVLVFLDQTVKTSQSDTSRIDRNRVQMTLQKQPNGTWLISDLLLK